MCADTRDTFAVHSCHATRVNALSLEPAGQDFLRVCATGLICGNVVRGIVTMTNSEHSYVAAGAQSVIHAMAHRHLRHVRARVSKPHLAAVDVVDKDRFLARHHIVRVDQLRRSRRRHGVDHDSELGSGQSSQAPLIDGSRR